MSSTTITPTAGYTPTYRLTRRGRLVVLFLSLLVVMAIGVVLASGAVGTQEAGTPELTETVMVGTGDTLWDIAAEAADGGDVRAMVERIKSLNALESGMVTAGQRLRVPK